MAKKKYSRRSKKIEPAPMTLTFEMGAGGTSYVDLGLATSILNRRAYHQGRAWAVAGMSIYAQGTNKTVRVATLQTNWVTYNAWKKGKALWDQMNDQVLDDEPSVKGKYHDFKIFMDSSHMTNFFDYNLQDDVADSAGRTLMPVVTSASAGTAVLPSTTNLEWNYSEYIIPNDGGSSAPSVANIVMNGATSLTAAIPRAALISGYALSRARPNVVDPNAPLGSADSWMNQLFDLGAVNDDIRDIIVEENDQAPYPIIGDTSGQERYPGGESNLDGLQLVSAPITSAAGIDYSGRINIPGFVAPCGLIYIKNDGPVTVQVHLVPGSYRGYMAPLMEDM